MRKLSQHTREWNARNAERVWRHRLERRRRFSRKKKVRQEGVRARSRWVLTLSGDLDLVGNARHTREELAGFDSIRIPDPRAPGLKLFVDMTQVQSIDPASALYLVAQVDRLVNSRKVRVTGNFPASPQAVQLLADVGFHKVMRTELPMIARSNKEPVVEISKGRARNQLDPKTTWLKLHAFLKAHLIDEQADAVYAALGECIENVKQHAFAVRDTGLWYALAIRPAEHLPARAIVLDLGQGIAGSVRRPKFDVVLTKFFTSFLKAIRFADKEGELTDEKIAAMAQRLRSDDWLCVYLASQGLRTQVKDKRRGTGLTGLRTGILESDSPGALHVLSGSAAVTWRKGVDPKPERLPNLRGTIVCIEFDAPPRTDPDAVIPE